MRDERPINLSPQDFENGGPSLEDQGYWRKKMAPLPRFLMRKKDHHTEKEEPSLSPSFPPIEQKKDSSLKTYSSLWRSYKKSEEGSSGLQNFSYQPMIQGRYVLVMTKLSMWTIAFSLFLLGILFYLTGFFSALYLLSSHETITVKSSLGQKLGTFIDKIDHKSPAPAPTSAPAESPAPSVLSPTLVPSSTGEPQPASSAPPVVSSTTPTSPVVESNVAPPSSTVTPSHAPTPQEATSSPPTTSPESNKALPTSYFMIQFGQFRTKDEAIKLAQELLLKGYAAKVFRSLDPTNKLWFYVRANTYPTRQNALEAIQHLPSREQQLFPLIIPSDLNHNTKIIFP